MATLGNSTSINGQINIVKGIQWTRLSPLRVWHGFDVCNLIPLAKRFTQFEHLHVAMDNP